MWMNKLPTSGTVLKEKAISYAQELKAEEFHASSGWFERWKVRFNVPFKANAGEKKAINLKWPAHGKKRTCLQFCHDLNSKTSTMLSSIIYKAIEKSIFFIF